LGVAASGVEGGQQAEEALSDSVRTALTAALSAPAPPELVFANEAVRQHYQDWLAHTRLPLQRKTPDWTETQRQEFLQTVWYESHRASLAPSLVLGLIEVESGFRKFAVSSSSARGYMQVMPFWTHLLAGAAPANLFHEQTNLRFGCVILRHYLALEAGDWTLALGRYNGSRGQMAYPRAVLSAQARWQAAEKASSSG
jgi:soluble lytic murein transglycosylase-like protein